MGFFGFGSLKGDDLRKWSVCLVVLCKWSSQTVALGETGNTVIRWLKLRQLFEHAYSQYVNHEHDTYIQRQIEDKFGWSTQCSENVKLDFQPQHVNQGWPLSIKLRSATNFPHQPFSQTSNSNKTNSKIILKEWSSQHLLYSLPSPPPPSSLDHNVKSAQTVLELFTASVCSPTIPDLPQFLIGFESPESGVNWSKHNCAVQLASHRLIAVSASNCSSFTVSMQRLFKESTEIKPHSLNDATSLSHTNFTCLRVIKFKPPLRFCNTTRRFTLLRN